MALPTDLLIGKIVTIFENEASSIAGVRDEIDDIKQELVSMKAFLNDFEGKKALTEGGETWVASVRGMAYDVEDIIDEFMYHMYEQGCHKGRFARWLHHTIRIPQNVWFRRQMSKKLRKISRMIKAIPERNQRYGVGGLEGTSSTCDDFGKWMRNQAESSLFIKEDELVGIERKKQLLMNWLMNGEQQQTVISVVGMGGSGKTTLVAKTFNDERVKKKFHCCAWLTVSQTYVIDDLFRSLIKEFHEARMEKVPADMNSMTYRELLQVLVNYLESKRYMVVLDDVWDIKLWKEIRIALPNTQFGSRIMLTTRREDVASYCFGVQSHIHHIQPLEKNEAWELFSSKAFSAYQNKCCPLDLESLAEELVEKCEGLPLAVVALGGLMSSKKPFEWKQVYNSLNLHLTNHPLLEPVKSILLLSFDDLPYPLKHCFLYCSLFPEDYSIRRKRLIRLWIAEGFVQDGKGATPEEVAESYLMQLILRSMLQVVQRNESGRPKACKMHDLMLELALSKSEKEKFGAVYDGKEVMDEGQVRRLSTQTTGGEIKLGTGMAQLRSFLMFVSDVSSSSSSNTLPSGCKLLRVLDLQYVPIDILPKELEYLFNLRYLNLRGTPVKKLPESIGKLCNLQTLDIRDSKIEVLPSGIAKLQNLRHLIMYRYNKEGRKGFRFVNGTRSPSNICMLKKLQVLACVELQGNIVRLVGNMTQLRRIGIMNVKERDEMDLCASIQKMKQLHYLFLMTSDEEEVLQTNTLCSPPSHLRTVILVGKLAIVPRWFVSLQSLTQLYLHWSRIEEDLLPYIEAVPNLGSLVLSNAYAGRELCFSRGFVKLKNLSLYNCPLLNKITIEKGVMSDLQRLRLSRCPELNTTPQGLQYLTKLKELALQLVSKELTDSIREGGLDREKVQHIPEIYHIYKTSLGMRRESLS
ncbi:PREDICTED: disease resistance [Prunus dulcis]|uniref:PREDICTED: disease resistance n=1 Tax=Prunus dulcis TaxID=3755 RepID=A0A5E4GM93_PRUDU|nr:disease resistance protein RPM1-like [Prunus dulcis]VVA40860.1 PREDICTED: disease resistance [Prunus dulcis]